MKNKFKEVLDAITVLLVMLLLSIDIGYGNGLKAFVVVGVIVAINTMISKKIGRECNDGNKSRY